MDVKVKKIADNAVIPTYAHDTDAGLDLTATSFEWDDSLRVWRYHTGLAFEIPEGYVGLLFPRSSICKTKVNLTNSVGVIDSGYRGEVTLVFRDAEHLVNRAPYKINERIGQLIIMPIPKINLVQSETLTDSERGTGGYGSTGK